jgi:hypothetical protein
MNIRGPRLTRTSKTAESSGAFIVENKISADTKAYAANEAKRRETLVAQREARRRGIRVLGRHVVVRG